ncbi:prostaglandin E synthase 2-like [Salvelinus namaycush]|uniref:Prostaglandin E synthase 2 n=1 Tax=Salvelinus namaycush TaxID=8040 RepID=A0A8U0PKN5_SALNM|nr:prostaglandin E synthase 2-like [Salvelinus namaycush]
MSASRCNIFCRTGWYVLRVPVAKISLAVALSHFPSRCSARTYGTGGTTFGSKLISTLPLRATNRRVFGFAFLFGGGVGLYQTIKFSFQQHFAEDELPNLPNRQYRIPTNQGSDLTFATDLTFTLYQYKTCPYCSKVRAFLDYYGLPYKVVEVNPVMHTEIKWSSEYQKVPILMVEGKEIVQLNNSSVIISAMKTCMIDKERTMSEVVKYFPRLPSTNAWGNEVLEYTNKYWVMLNEIKITEVYTSKNARKEEVRWRQWADDWLVNRIKPNVYRTPAEALATYDHIVREGNFGSVPFAKYGGAFYMFWASKVLKIWYKLHDDVREDLYMAVNEWITAIGRKRKFMGGDKPNLADLAVYGVLRSMEDLESFYDVMENTKVKKWYLATEKQVREHGGRNLCRKPLQNYHGITEF